MQIQIQIMQQNSWREQVTVHCMEMHCCNVNFISLFRWKSTVLLWPTNRKNDDKIFIHFFCCNGVWKTPMANALFTFWYFMKCFAPAGFPVCDNTFFVNKIMNLFCMTAIIVENYFDAIIWGENCVKTHFQCKNKMRNNVGSNKEFAEFIELNYILTIFAIIKTTTYAFEC